MILETMDTSSPIEESFVETLEVSSTSSSSIHVGWQILAPSFPFIEGYRVHYQKVNSKYVQYGPELERSETEYEIRNLVADTYYKVCLVVYRNYTDDFRECVDASTTNWQLPVSIGSSIGAVLALSVIVLIVLLSRCQIPVKYRRKKRHNSSRYDNMSSNYLEEHYDFSETVTHGNEEDFLSECEQDEDGLCDLTSPETARPKQVENVVITNGLCKNHVHPHGHLHQQHRNSLGRIHCSASHGGHHPRTHRAYSISSDHPHAALFSQHISDAKKDSHRLHRSKECHEMDDALLVKDVDRRKRAHQFHREHSLQCSDLLKHDSVSDVKQRPPLVSQQSSQGFSFIDEMPDISTAKAISQPKRCDETSPMQKNVKTERVFVDSIKFDDLSAFGAVGGVKETFIGQAPVRHWDSTKPVEMSDKNANLELGESSSFDEHAL